MFEFAPGGFGRLAHVVWVLIVGKGHGPVTHASWAGL